MAGLGLGSSSSLGQMSPNTARRLAALIVADAQQLEERAQDSGVTAFLGRAVKRERPNERFLQNTLRNLASANRRQEEKAMWAAREAEQQQEQQQPQQHHHHSQRRQQEWRCEDRGRARLPGRRSSTGNQLEQRRSQRSYSGSRSRSKGRSRKRRRRHRRSSPDASGDGSYSSDSSSHEGRSRQRHGRQQRSSSPAVPVSSAQKAGSSGQGQPPAAGPDMQLRRAGSRHDSGDWSEGDTGADQQLVQWLAASKTVRGRGSIGPHADVAGPYLAPPQHPEQAATVKGPAKPVWLQADEDGQRSARPRPNAAFLKGVLMTQGLAAGAAAQRDDSRSRERSPSGSQGAGSSSSGTSSSRDSRSRRHRSRHKHSRSNKVKKRKKEKKQKKDRKAKRRSSKSSKPA